MTGERRLMSHRGLILAVVAFGGWNSDVLSGSTFLSLSGSGFCRVVNIEPRETITLPFIRQKARMLAGNAGNGCRITLFDVFASRDAASQYLSGLGTDVSYEEWREARKKREALHSAVPAGEVFSGRGFTGLRLADGVHPVQQETIFGDNPYELRSGTHFARVVTISFGRLPRVLRTKREFAVGFDLITSDNLDVRLGREFTDLLMLRLGFRNVGVAIRNDLAFLNGPIVNPFVLKLDPPSLEFKKSRALNCGNDWTGVLTCCVQ